MALTERRRAALFQGLSAVLDDEEAVGELLSYFPSRDVDEPATRDFVDARIANVEARIAEVDGRVSALDARVESLDARMQAGFEAVDARMAAGFDAVEARFAVVDAGFATVDARFASIDARFVELRAELQSDLHAEIQSLTRWAVGAIVAAFGLLIALGLVR